MDLIFMNGQYLLDTIARFVHGIKRLNSQFPNSVNISQLYLHKMN